jgi:hypothetical protein
LIEVYRVKVNSVSSSPAVININPSASVLVYKGYTNGDGKVHIKAKPENLNDFLYRVIDTGVNSNGKKVSYMSKQWVDGDNDQNVTLVTTDAYDWFRDYFTNASRFWPRFNDGTISWPRDLEGHPDIYILTGGKWSVKPSTRVFNDVMEYVKMEYPNSKVIVTDKGPVANNQSAWKGKILIFFDPNILTVNNALSGFFFDVYKGTNQIKDAGITMSDKYPDSNEVILQALGKELTQTYLVGNIPLRFDSYSILNPSIGLLTEPSPLDWAGISLIKYLTKYYGDGVTGTIFKTQTNTATWLQGYFSNKVAVPNQSNITKEYYVTPADEPGI